MAFGLAGSYCLVVGDFVRLVLLFFCLFFKVQTLTTRGVCSKFNSGALEKLFCELEPYIFDFNGLNAMNEVEALHGDCQLPPCAAESEGTGRTTKSSNLLRQTI